MRASVMDGRTVLLRTVTEAQWMRTVTEMAEALGWAVFHPHDSRHSRAGWPDLVLSKPPRLVFAELKKETGQPTAEQYDWLERLRATPGVESFCFWPSDGDLVERVLRGGAMKETEA